jgi:hypothetical protein
MLKAFPKITKFSKSTFFDAKGDIVMKVTIVKPVRKRVDN